MYFDCNEFDYNERKEFDYNDLIIMKEKHIRGDECIQKSLLR